MRAKALNPRAVFAHPRDHLTLLALQVGDDLIELEELLADQPLALERLAGEVLPAELKRLACTQIELVELILPAITLVYEALFGGDEVGHVAAQPVQLLQLLAIAVIEDLHGVLGPVEEPGESRFESERQSVEHGWTRA
jgi:hypothetical protein